MGMPGPWELLIILAIVALLFGTKKLRNIGGDLGGAVKGFKNAMKDTDEKLTHETKPVDTGSANEQDAEKIEKNDS